MTTSKQAQANKRNAKKSTGPKTPEGKQAASKNARKHNLFTTDPIVDGEDPAQYDMIEEAWYHYLDPIGPMETTLTQGAVDIAWRLRRVLPAENALWARAAEDDTVNLAHELDKLSRHEARLLRSLKQAVADLRATQKADEERAEENLLAQLRAQRDALWADMVKNGQALPPPDPNMPIDPRPSAPLDAMPAPMAEADAREAHAAGGEESGSQSVSAPMGSFCQAPQTPENQPGNPASGAVKPGKVANGGRARSSLKFL